MSSEIKKKKKAKVAAGANGNETDDLDDLPALEGDGELEIEGVPMRIYKESESSQVVFLQEWVLRGDMERSVAGFFTIYTRLAKMVANELHRGSVAWESQQRRTFKTLAIAPPN